MSLGRPGSGFVVVRGVHHDPGQPDARSGNSQVGEETRYATIAYRVSLRGVSPKRTGPH